MLLPTLYYSFLNSFIKLEATILYILLKKIFIIKLTKNPDDKVAQQQQQPQQQNQFNNPISKWNNQNVLDWLRTKLPHVYESHKETFIQNEIDGESLLAFNDACLNLMNIQNTHLR